MNIFIRSAEILESDGWVPTGGNAIKGPRCLAQAIWAAAPDDLDARLTAHVHLRWDVGTRDLVAWNRNANKRWSLRLSVVSVGAKIGF